MEMTLLGWQIKCMAILPLQVGRATCLESTPVPFLPGRNYKVTSNRNHVWPQIQETHRIAIIRANNINNNQRIHHILIIFPFLIQHLQYFTMELLATMAFEIVSFCRSHCSFLRGCPAGYFGYLRISLDLLSFHGQGPFKTELQGVRIAESIRNPHKLTN